MARRRLVVAGVMGWGGREGWARLEFGRRAERIGPTTKESGPAGFPSGSEASEGPGAAHGGAGAEGARRGHGRPGWPAPETGLRPRRTRSGGDRAGALTREHQRGQSISRGQEGRRRPVFGRSRRKPASRRVAATPLSFFFGDPTSRSLSRFRGLFSGELSATIRAAFQSSFLVILLRDRFHDFGDFVQENFR
jgi:hypothetical protein